MSVTAELCDRIVATGFDDIGNAARAAARRLVIDGIAIAIAGTTEEAIQILGEHHKDQGGTAAATALGLGFRLNTVSAAALNGAAMHVLDFEPMWSPANHALSTTLPAILAIAEQRGIGGSEVLAALVKGVEIQGWLREASGLFEARNVTFHPPGVVGPIGSAVAAGHLMKLDAHRLANAVGIAASRSGSLLANVGTMTKSTHCGNAASLGLEAALLAERGFTGNTGVIEAAQGYAAGFFPGTFKPELLANFARAPFRLVEPGYAVKMFPSQFATHFAITAAIELHGRIGDPKRIRSVTLTAPQMNYIDRAKPPTGLAGKFSLQYTTAAGLLDGAVKIATFTDERLAQADMQALLPKITLKMSPDIPARFEKMHVELEVELDDGSNVATRCNGPRGVWGSPPIPEADHLAKVRDCLALKVKDAVAEEIIELASSIERLDGEGVRKLLRLAGCFGG